MKVAILEWVCGGGMGGEAIRHHDLFVEGLAMLRCLADSLINEGHAVTVALDSGFERDPWQDGRNQNALVPNVIQIACESPDSYLNHWKQIAANQEAVLVVAPEIDGILEWALSELQGDVPIVNCSGAFLRNASDKWLTANCLRHAGIPHPPTVLGIDALSQLDVQSELMPLSEEKSFGSANPGFVPESKLGQLPWCFKPKLGAGGEGVWIVESSKQLEYLPPLDDFIAQPFLKGQAASCCAIVDAQGHFHWLPLMSQELEWIEHTQAGSKTEAAAPKGLHYVGGEPLNLPYPQKVLEKVAGALGEGALGWVGIDLLWDSEDQEWHVIEINPRVTTSIVPLVKMLGTQIVERLVSSTI